MKSTILWVACMFASGLKAQTTVTLSPSEDAAIGYHDSGGTSGNNYGTATQLAGYAVPAAQSFGLNVNRGLLKFDLSSIPANAVITNAALDLYAFGSVGIYSGHTGTSNNCYLERVTANWSETTVTWNNQPVTTTTNRVFVQGTTNPTLDYPNIDVTLLIRDIFTSLNNGIMLKMTAENPTNILIFCSKDHPNSLKHPKLRVTYQIPTGINEGKELQASATCFPNPAKDEVHISTDTAVAGYARISVYNTLGLTVKEQTFDASMTGNDFMIDTKDLGPGVYYFSIDTGDATLPGKFIIE